MTARPNALPLAMPGPVQRVRTSARGIQPGSLVWFIHHEIRLAFRDWVRPGTRGRAAIVSAIILIVLHAVAYGVVQLLPVSGHPAPGMLLFYNVYISLGLASLFTMMIAQAMEAVTRAFYVRGDLELILSSPASPRRLFAVRMVATTMTTLSLVGFLVLPFVDMMAFTYGWRWLGCYGVLISMAALSQTLALCITVGLFHWIGPKRTRVVAQVVGAVLGATAAIGGQVPAILKSGTLSRLALLSDPATVAAMPEPSSPIWWPAKAVMGDPTALAFILIVSLGALALAIVSFSRGFSEMVVAAAGISETRATTSGKRRFARLNSPARALRQKELRLIMRDPWLVSQSLMQILYLIPPALLLWRNFGAKAGVLAVLVPVIVMASGQLAGGLAWLAISAEDAPDLIATAPIGNGLAVRAKIEAVTIAVGVIVGPFLLALAIASPFIAAVGVVFSLLAIGTATLIQMRFKVEARRSQFRRRQRSSRLATMAETLSGIAWAGAAGMTAAGSVLAGIAIVIALGLTLLCLPAGSFRWIARTIRPAKAAR